MPQKNSSIRISEYLISLTDTALLNAAIKQEVILFGFRLVICYYSCYRQSFFIPTKKKLSRTGLR